MKNDGEFQLYDTGDDIFHYFGEVDQQGNACGEGKAIIDYQEVYGTFYDDWPHGICTSYCKGKFDRSGEIRHNRRHGKMVVSLGREQRLENYLYHDDKILMCSCYPYQNTRSKDLTYKSNQLRDPKYVRILHQGDVKKSAR